MSDLERRREERHEQLAGPSLRRLVELERLVTVLSGTLESALSGGPDSFIAPGVLLVSDPRVSRLSVECLLFFWKHGEGISIDIVRGGVWVEVARERSRFFPYAGPP